MQACCRRIMSMLGHFHHMFLNLLRLRMGGRRWSQGHLLNNIKPELVSYGMPLLAELVFDIHQQARAVILQLG